MKQKILYFNMVDFEDISFEKSLLKDDDQIEIEIINNVPDADFLKYAANADGIAVDYMNVSAEIMGQLKCCKVIVRRGIGYDNINLKAASENGICVSNVPEYCQQDVALHTIALALSCSRYITRLNSRMQSGSGNFDDIKMYRLNGKVFGLVSFGSIPRTMVPMLKTLGMEVVAWDPFLEDEVFETYGVKRVNVLTDLLKISDFVSIHVPLNDKTRNLIDREELKCIKQGAFLLNTARGGIINEKALAEAIQDKRIAGAGLDVIADEVNFSTPLMGMDEVILTPHLAYYTEESSMELRQKSFEAMYSVLAEQKPPRFLLNKEVIGKAKFEQIQK